MNAGFELESFAHIPMNGTLCFIISSCCAAICRTSRPLGLVSLISAILVTFSAPTIVLETVRINSLHYLHFSIGEFSNSVSDLNVTKTKR